mgnify:CR=1 FL=1
MDKREIGSSPVEVEKTPRYRFMITRHAERLPSGELSPEGIEHAKQKGAIVKGAEVLKAYASDHASKRAFKTGDLISAESGVKSEASGKQYATREVPDIQYDVLKPDLYHIIAGLKLLIEEPTLAEAFSEPELKKLIDEAVAKDMEKIVSKKGSDGQLMIDMEKLPVDIQMKIAPIRQKYQKVGFEKCLRDYPEVVYRMAMGLGHQLTEEFKIAERYSKVRKADRKPAQKDVILNTATHGLFTESLLMKAGIYVKPDGQEIQDMKVEDFQNKDFGGFVQPGESIYLDVEDPAKIPEKIPVNFEGANRPQSGRVFINRKKLGMLNKDYLEWKKSQQG